MTGIPSSVFWELKELRKVSPVSRLLRRELRRIRRRPYLDASARGSPKISCMSPISMRYLLVGADTGHWRGPTFPQWCMKWTPDDSAGGVRPIDSRYPCESSSDELPVATLATLIEPELRRVLVPELQIRSRLSLLTGSRGATNCSRWLAEDLVLDSRDSSPDGSTLNRWKEESKSRSSCMGQALQYWESMDWSSSSLS